MKTILITGLDGSGKSTLLSRLLKNKQDKPYEIIFVPQIATEGLEDYPEILDTALFINTLSEEADQLRRPQLKAIALFASMLLFKDLLYVQQQKAPHTIFCERHPLIDTAVYARFYAEKLGPDSISPEILKDLDQRFPHALSYLLNFLPEHYKGPDDTAKAASFLHFIYQWFFVAQKHAIVDMAMLFGLQLPDEIYFLKARPEVLYERIEHRSVKEAHESPEVFKKLDAVYASLFKSLKSKVSVQEINANKIEELDIFYEKIYAQQLSYGTQHFKG